MPTISEPRDLFVNELKSMLYVERQLAESVLPKLTREITEQELRGRIEDHLEETRRHVANLERCFELLGEEAKDDKSHAIDGLTAQHDKVAKNIEDDRLRDIFDAGAAAKTEHLEIAAYRGLITMAEAMGESEIVDLLEQNLDDDKNALEQAEEVAQKLAKEAAAAR
jgi:ferritin-like metal-binding protein YciE